MPHKITQLKFIKKWGGCIEQIIYTLDERLRTGKVFSGIIKIRQNRRSVNVNANLPGMGKFVFFLVQINIVREYDAA
jgi:hypothetical protein